MPEDHDVPPAPLAGIRVVEAGAFIAAPLAATLLADLGADVIKVEPLGGDPARRVGEGGERALSATFLATNRGKRSVELDLGSEQGCAQLQAIVATADVLIHNLPDVVAKRLGIDEQSLAALLDRLVLCRITAFGDTGPLAGRRALDPVIQAMTGLASVTGEPDGDPMRCAAPIVDVSTALSASGAICAQLLARERGARPQPLSVALYDVAMLLGAPLYALQSLLGGPPPRRGNGSYALLGDQFAVRDGFLSLVVWDDGRWQALCHLLGLPELLEDPRFETTASRLAQYDALRPVLAAAIATWEGAALQVALDEQQIPCGMTLALDQVARDEHPLSTGILYGEQRVAGPEAQLVATPALHGGERMRAAAPPPALGAHTVEVLAEL